MSEPMAVVNIGIVSLAALALTIGIFVCGMYYTKRVTRTYSIIDALMAIMDYTLAIGLFFALVRALVEGV